ncbi:MAG: hypothetical protein J0I41_18825 [Filimonas sp.]|nr:hypothetical protein [Filimonas sp.]
MILYLLKSTLCTVAFFALYKLLFEKEQMHRFKRYYLLLSVAASFIIPLVTLNTTGAHTQILPATFDTGFTIISALPVADNAATIDNTTVSTVSWTSIVTVLYSAISILLLVRFLLSLRGILAVIKKAGSIVYQNKSTIVLLEQQVAPHTLFNYIFINRDDYNNGNTEKEILLHELVHVRQKHTWDVMVIQLLQIFFWFNPVLRYYRKAIQLNHEFLADEGVVKQCSNVAAYQYLLIDKASRQKSFSLTSQFNYSLTKKRLLMMTRITSKRNALLRQLALIPTAAVCILLFSKNVEAQTNKADQAQSAKGQTEKKKGEQPPTVFNPSKAAVFMEKDVPFTTEGVSQQQLDEYTALVNKNKNIYDNHQTYNGFSDEEKKKLESIYVKMSREQQAAQSVRFISNPLPLEKTTPSAKQYESYKDASVYGVWIDRKKVPVSELDKYSNTDFSQVTISKLYGNAAKGRSYTHQLDLMTNDFYSAYYKKAMERHKELQLISIRKYKPQN